jgi:hypothetical protein
VRTAALKHLATSTEQHVDRERLLVSMRSKVSTDTISVDRWLMI